MSIGIPTYNRVATLRRAVESALAQTHTNLEIILSDDASDDGTEELCRQFAARDARIDYVRHEHHVGLTANFNSLFARWRGEYVLMLADDDWLDPDYVARCLEVLRAQPDAGLVGGRARYFANGEPVADGIVHEHLEADPASRIISYLGTVDDNGVLYGMMPRRVLDRARPHENVLGNDWLHVARLACQGTIWMLDDVRINRETGGTSVDIGSILSAFEASGWQARVPQLVIAFYVLRDIAWGHPVYREIGRARRVWIGVRAALASIRWRHLAWHLVTPTLLQLGKRRRGRPVWEAYLRVTRKLGAGQRP